MLNIKTTKITSTIIAAVMGLSIVGSSVTAEAAHGPGPNHPPRMEQPHKVPGHGHGSAPRIHRPGPTHGHGITPPPPPPRIHHERHDDRRYSEGERNTAGIVGLVLGAVIASAIANDN